MIDRLRSWLTAEMESQRQGYQPIQLSETTADALTQPYDREAVVARPHRDNGGIEAMEEVLESLHSVDGHSPRFSSATENVSPAFAFEIRYGADTATGTDRTLTLQYLSTADETDGLLERQLQHRYHDSQIERRPAPVCHAEEDQYAAGATLGLRKYTLFPIQNIRLDGWRSDPTGSILTEMARDSTDEMVDATVVCQLMFKPARRDWLQGVADGHGVGDDLGDDRLAIGDDAPGVRELSKRLTEPVVKRNVIFPWHWVMPWEWEYYEDPPTRKDKAIAAMLEELDGKAWKVSARIFAIASDPDVAVSRASSTASMWRNFYEYKGDQTFIPQPLTGEALDEELQAAAGREWRDAGIVKPQVEVAGLVNIPEAQYVSTNKMEWSLSRPGEGVPVGTPRYDFDAAGVANDSEEAKQVAMLTDPDAGTSDDAFWFGFGSKHGTEVGIFEDYLNAHMMVTGGTRKGKTTALTNLASQIYDRGYGGLVIVNGKEKDEDRFIEEWPADRDREDFVFIDTGDPDYGTDKRVRFNLLELPTDAEPGTNTFESAVQTLTDDWSASFAEAGGGSDNYWGALMSRVTRTVINGLTKSGMAATPLDVAAAVSTADGLSQFSDLMNDERIDFVREAAERIAEKEDADLEPLAGRTDLLTQHAGLRNFLCARTPTASIQEFVREGKVCVLRVDPNLGETETKFMLTPLVRRFYTAKKTLPDAPRFYLIWDEFDKGVSPMTNVHEMLSIAGGHDFRMILACQAPSNQLYDRLKKSMQNQIDTAISFGTGEEDARYIASHHTVDAADLAGTGRYKFWLRTYYQTADDEDKTYSYKVDAFPPAREARAAVDGTSPVDPDELKRQSAERYGDVPESAEQLRAESAFYGDADGITATDGQRTAVYQAIHDTALAIDVDAVTFAEAEGRLRWYLDAADAPQSHLDDLLDRVLAHDLDQRKADGEIRYTVSADAIEALYRIGNGVSDGGEAHRRLFRAAYDELTRLGGRVRLLSSGAEPRGSTPDFRVELPPDFGADADPVLAALAGDDPQPGDVIEGECESSTGRTQPAQTVRNLAAAAAADRPCLFVVGDGGDRGFADDARQVSETLAEPPCVKREGGERTHYYMDGPLVPAADGRLWRPRTGAHNDWYRDEGGDLVLGDTDGQTFLRTDDDALREGVTAADIVDSECRIAPESAVDTDAWQEVRRPAIPEVLGVDPDAAAWEIVVIPDDDRDRNVSLYAGGPCVPLAAVGVRDGTEGESEIEPLNLFGG